MNGKIRAAFEGRLSTWAGTKGHRVAWQNVPFTPVHGELYLRPALIPAQTDSIDMEGKHRGYTGVFQVNIIAPSGSGSGAAETVAADLAALYPVNLRIVIDTTQYVMVLRPVSVAPQIQHEGTFTLPAYFYYRMDTV